MNTSKQFIVTSTYKAEVGSKVRLGARLNIATFESNKRRNWFLSEATGRPCDETRLHNNVAFEDYGDFLVAEILQIWSADIYHPKSDTWETQEAKWKYRLVEVSETKEKTLTRQQRRYLNEIRRDGVRVYNGRAHRPIKALQALGLITADFGSRTQTNGQYHLVEVITARPVL